MSVDDPAPPPRPPLYPLFRLLGRTTLRIFIRRIQVRLRAPIPERGPIIVASNHPNSLLDPITVLSVTPRPVHFLAKSGLFFPPLGWILRSFGVLPLYRRMDKPSTMAGNDRTFEACHRLLARGGAIGIFPEGTSHDAPELRQIRTGAVRIALEAEEKAGFSLGVRIVPMGLTFPERSRFRSELGIHVDRPIDLAPFLDDYRRNPRETVRRVTDLLQERMKDLFVHLDRVELASTVEDVSTLYRDEVAADRFHLTREVAQAVQHFHRHEPETFARMEPAVRTYFARLRRTGLQDEAIRDLDAPNRGAGWILGLLVAGLLGLPFALYGTVNNVVPWLIARLLGPRLATDPVDIAERKVLVGMAVFPLFIAAQVAAAWMRFGPIAAIAYGISLAPTGFFAIGFWRKARAAWRRIRVRLLARRRPGLVRGLAARRAGLTASLDELWERYRPQSL